MNPASLFGWLGETSWSVALRESQWVYPIVESVHVLALCLFVGFAILFDLRLLGWTMRDTPASEVFERLMPWTISGFLLMVTSGLLLFYSDPVEFYANVFFRIKLALLAVAGVNALVFQRTTYRQMADWDLADVPPRRARAAGMVSLVVWAGIIVAGRLIAYNWFDTK
jgi:Family of unknown function (DUF6644)